MFEWHPDTTGRSFGIRLIGKATHDDLLQILPRLEAAIAEFGKIRLMVELRQIAGMEPAAFWEDLKFEMKHLNNVERLAVVGDALWQKWWVRLVQIMVRPFSATEVRYFEYPHSDEAWEWLILPPPWALRDR